MGILEWIFKHLKLDDNDEIDLRFGVVTLCIWTSVLTFIGAAFYLLIDLRVLSYLLEGIFLGSLALYFYCRRNIRLAYVTTYLFMSIVCILIHFFTTIYLGNCGTVFFMAAALLGPHMYPLLGKRGIYVMDLILLLALNLTFWINLTIPPIYGEAVRGPFRFVLSNLGLLTFIFMLYINASSQDFIKATRQKLIDEASHEIVLDALTGLGNRRMLDQYRAELTEAVSENFPLSVAMVDIDFFKRINDTYGHAVGDKILVYIAQHMRDFFRTGDLLIRWGGEEFLIFLKRTGIESSVVLMENFRQKMQKSLITVNGVPMYIHVTIGVKEHPPHTAIEDSIKRSDELMYQGKLSGRNRVMWEEK